MTIQTTVVEVDIESWLLRPAVTSRGDLYLIDGNKLIGKVRKSSSRYRPNSSLYERVSIVPNDDATREYFKDDPYMVATNGTICGARYDGVFGDRWLTGDDGNNPLYLDTRIVDCFEFDFGICHHSFKDIEGFDSYHKKQNMLRIHESHKQRRRRKTNKIKRVA